MMVLLIVAALADVSVDRGGFAPQRLGVLKVVGEQGAQYYACAFSADGKYLAARSQIGVDVYDTRTWKAVSKFQVPVQNTYQLAFSGDGKVIVGADQTLKMWDPATGQEIGPVPGAEQAYQFKTSPDGKRLATLTVRQTLKILDLQKKDNDVEIQGALPGFGFAFSADGSRLYACLRDGSIKGFSARDGSVQVELQGGARVTGLVVTRDGRWLIGQGQDAVTRRWDLSTGAEGTPLEGLARNDRELMLSPDGQYLIGFGHRSVKILDLKTGKQAANLRGRGNAQSVSVSPDGRYLACTGGGALTLFGNSPRPEPAGPKGRGYLGIQPGDAEEGCLVQSVVPGTPAERAGLREGDIIKKVGDEELKTAQDAYRVIQGRKADEEVELLILRDGKEQKIKVKLGVFPGDEQE
jgi:WD40 repeat protein